MSRTVIIADSTCDLPSDWVRQLDVRIVPTYVNFGTESLADDGVELTRNAFYTRLVSSTDLPTTAAPSLGLTRQIMKQALQDADLVIGITAPAKLSGIYNTFRLVAEQTDPSRVTLIDSGMLSMGMGWQIIAANEMLAQGLGPTEIKTRLEAMQPYINVWAALDTMVYLRRSGRVGWAAAFVGDLLQIKPLIHLQKSVISSVTRVRTSQRAFDKLVELAQQAAPLERLAVLHTNNLDKAYRLTDALHDIRPDASSSRYNFAIVDVTPVIGVHVGPNGLGLALVRQN
ncbi:MAG: DegV family protein [Anaerolineae bacterium]|nr:DegV family protein [Anaerolineae bacterium]